MNSYKTLKKYLVILVLILTGAFMTVHLEAATPLNTKGYRPSFPIAKEFRGILAGWAYLKANQYFYEGKWKKITPFLRIRATLEPELTDSWSVGSWHLAFNLSKEAESPSERERMIEVGIEFLKEGIKKNPKTAHLYFDLAWTYYMRLGDLEEAIRLFQLSLNLEYKRSTVVWLAYLYRGLGRSEEEIKVWEDYLERFPTDEKAEEHLKELILQRKLS